MFDRQEVGLHKVVYNETALVEAYSHRTVDHKTVYHKAVQGVAVASCSWLLVCCTRRSFLNI